MFLNVVVDEEMMKTMMMMMMKKRGQKDQTIKRVASRDSEHLAHTNQEQPVFCILKTRVEVTGFLNLVLSPFVVVFPS